MKGGHYWHVYWRPSGRLDPSRIIRRGTRPPRPRMTPCQPCPNGWPPAPPLLAARRFPQIGRWLASSAAPPFFPHPWDSTNLRRAAGVHASSCAPVRGGEGGGGALPPTLVCAIGLPWPVRISVTTAAPPSRTSEASPATAYTFPSGAPATEVNATQLARRCAPAFLSVLPAGRALCSPPLL